MSNIITIFLTRLIGIYEKKKKKTFIVYRQSPITSAALISLFMRVRATLTILIFILSLLLRRRRRRRRNIRRKSLNRRYFFIISITPRFRSRQHRFSHLKFLYVRN